MNTRVIHFEIHAIDPEKLGKFYTDIFGWEIKEWKMPGVKDENRYWNVMTAPEGSKEPGINGGIIFRKTPPPKGNEPVSSYICTIHVPSVAEWLKKIEIAGGAVALPKMPIAGMAWLAYAKDPEGNIFGIYEDDPSAK